MIPVVGKTVAGIFIFETKPYPHADSEAVRRTEVFSCWMYVFWELVE